ncbi:MAG: DUF362 domain-containing protein, partial [Candidatus Omnitrophica bacterium]|nr:DUF362 domain-containing protein [Candidatus Omnitrophota bacterium]
GDLAEKVLTLVPPERIEDVIYFNPSDFAKILVDLYQLKKPNLTIIDGIIGLEGDGPSSKGITINTSFILAGSDCVAIDSILALIMGIRPSDILTNREAKRRNLGITEIEKIEILGDNLSDFICKDFKLPSTSLVKKLPPPLINFARKLIRFYPYIEHKNCIRCCACLNTCPTKAITLKNNRININYYKCISCFCCQEACLYSAIKVKRSILAKIIGI